MNEPAEFLAQPLGWRRILTVALIGAGAGFVSFCVGLMLEKYVLTPIACQATSSVIACTNVTQVSHNIALLFGACVGIVLLIRWMIYRPLLVIIGVVISLWGVAATVLSFHWLTALSLTVLVFAAVFCLFVWLASVRRFWLAALLSVIAVVVLRVAFLI